MKRIYMLIAIVGITAIASAMSTYGTVVKTKYNVQPNSNIGKSSCKLCHVGAKGGALNKYGIDLGVALKAANTKRLTAEILASVESKDSNGDGVKNGESFKKDVLP